MMDKLDDKALYDAEIEADLNGFEIAVIGMSGRFPGASNIDIFWDNLRNGIESISTFTDDELLNVGVAPNLLRSPDYVKAGGVLDGIDMFDASFFKYSPREAKTMDPQHRLFLESAYEALQHAGYDPQRYRRSIGVFAGVSTNSYGHNQPSDNSTNVGMVDSLQAHLGNDGNFLSTRVSYKLNLKGPSLTIQTACSTSLVAAHCAYQSLLSGESDIALAGGVSIRFPQKSGYIYQKEGILSPDGHCRAFDESAQGTVAGEGVGTVVLKRLEDALADGDCIHAVIKGSALNNDGSRKVGFTAPSVEGQADVIADAQSMAEVAPDSIGYIETHGTGTQLGDPIEIAALTKAFRKGGSEKQHFCAIGSLKTNIGHLDAAAGIAGFIKAIMVLKHKQIPPSLHFKQANPQIDFVHSPFYVNQALTDWHVDSAPLRAGVSSFGIGGSNVHMILEEAPQQRLTGKSLRSKKLLLLSANSPAALDRIGENLIQHLETRTTLSLADVAFTLQTGRQQFKHRRFLVSDNCNDVITVLDSKDPKRVFDGVFNDNKRSVVFMLPGQGAQYVDMGRDLYEEEPDFRKHFDECCEYLKKLIDIDLRELIFPNKEDNEIATQKINQTSITQPALFAIEYSLAQLWISWGVHPQAMIGHSIGEYVAACLSGVFSLSDALSLVSARAQMMQSMDAGSMLAVPQSAGEVQKSLVSGLSVAAINEPSMCVVSGLTEQVDKLQTDLAAQGVECRQLHTSHAFHSEMMDDIIQSFEDLVGGIKINKPKIPYISNLTGNWISAEEIADPAYWSRHLRHTVKFAAGLDTLFENPGRVFLEVGPGQTLSTLVRRNPSKGADHQVISSMRHPKNQQSDSNVLMNSLGRLWLVGIDIDWASFYAGESRQRVPLPGYPFERHSFWIDQRQTTVKPKTNLMQTNKVTDPGHWLYAPGWKSSVAPLLNRGIQGGEGCWLVLSDSSILAEQIVNSFREIGYEVAVVTPADKFSCLDSNRYTVQPGKRGDMETLFAELHKQGRVPNSILHLWSAKPPEAIDLSKDVEEMEMGSDFYSVLQLVQVLSEDMPAFPVELIVVTSGTQSVTGSEILCPYRSAVQGLCRVIPQEQDRLRCRTIDIQLSNETDSQKVVAEQLFIEVNVSTSDQVVALRQNGRWVQVFEPVVISEPNPADQYLRDQGVYLITGGFGKIGLLLAHYLAQTVGARLFLIGRSELPSKASWDEQLSLLGEDSAVGRKILAMRALEEAGADVIALSADVSDEKQMREVVAEAIQRYGQINGVIHAATSTSQRSFQLLRDLDREACEMHFIPKIRGLQVLDRVLEGQTPDFCIIMSSLASMLGGLNFGAYASANAFMDVFAHSRSGTSSLPWLSVNWDGWYFGDTAPGVSSAVTRLAMTPEEGLDIFSRVVGINIIPQLAVSTWDLQSRMDQWIAQSDARESDDQVSSTISDSNGNRSQITKNDFSKQGIENSLIKIWADLLGIDGINVDDNFYDLGGDSLLALQVTSRLRECLLADLSVATVLEVPTIRELTQHIMMQQQSLTDGNKVSEMLKHIKSISPDEKEKLLAKARKVQSDSK